MSETQSPFQYRHDFKNECFYYFLPTFNLVRKNEIGEKINKFHGVNFSYLTDFFQKI